jgi:hypothetical protein
MRSWVEAGALAALPAGPYVRDRQAKEAEPVSEMLDDISPWLTSTVHKFSLWRRLRQRPFLDHFTRPLCNASHFQL